MSKIHMFTGPYTFLSNFYIEPDGTHVEGEYQAQKADTHEAREIQRARMRRMAPGQAKRAGQLITPIRKNWDSIRLHIMTKCVRQKFVDHSELAALLVDTGTWELQEGNTWGDRYWGMVRGVGENHLGKILMQVREELRTRTIPR